jgi:ParB family chromosome partitioning protein
MDSDQKIFELNLDDILPNRLQPRKVFDEEKLRELASSIQEHGVISPIYVRPLGDKYEIVAGERRYKASEMAGKKTIPAIIKELSDKESAEIALIENIQRQDLSPIDEAVSIKTILDRGYLNQTNLATKLGKSQATIANKLRLLNLTDEVQEALINNKISERHARSLLKLKNQQQVDLLHRIIKERLTVRQTEAEIRKIVSQNLEKQPVIEKQKDNKNLAEIIKKRTNARLSEKKEEIETLFEDIKEGDLMLQEEAKPGFMNIDEIVENAEEIYPKKAEVKVDELLDSSSTELIPPTPKENEKEIETPLFGGKFFNFSPEEEETPLFDFESNDLAEDIKLETNILEGIKEKSEVIEEKVDVLQEETITPTIPTKEEVSESLYNLTQEINQEGPKEEIVSKYESGASFFDGVKPVYDIPNDDELNIPKSTAVEEPEEINIEEEIVETPIFEALKPVQNNSFGADIKTALSTIRNCVETIKKYGFQVDMEEFDLETMHQVVIKINKK